MDGITEALVAPAAPQTGIESAPTVETTVTPPPASSVGPISITPIPDASTQQITTEAPVAQESLTARYARLAERFRELGIKQFDGNLTEAERLERQELEQMAGAGLFDPTLSDSQIAVKEQALKAQSEAQGDPQVLAEEYRALGKELYDHGLGPAQLERYNYLSGLAKQGVFSLPKAA